MTTSEMLHDMSFTADAEVLVFHEGQPADDVKTGFACERVIRVNGEKRIQAKAYGCGSVDAAILCCWRDWRGLSHSHEKQDAVQRAKEAL